MIASGTHCIQQPISTDRTVIWLINNNKQNIPECLYILATLNLDL